MRYYDQCKKQQQKLELLEREKLKAMTSRTPGEVTKDAQREYEQAQTDVQTAKDTYDNINAQLTRELSRFDQDKSRDLRRALDLYAETQIRHERQVINTAGVNKHKMLRYT
jgi:t-SNARE complex subunit (syntaxin)